MKKSYFASDFHLGSPDRATSLAREKRLVSWLDSIKEDVENLFLVGDVFDFWYEYKRAIPKHYSRFLGKLAELSDLGVNIIFFKGNHDMWTFGYLEEELGLKVISEEWIGKIGDKTFYIHHGDALGPGDRGYKFIRKVFRSKWATWLFHRLHPNFGIGLAQLLSGESRKKNLEKDAIEIPLEQEFQFQFAKKLLEEEPIDYFIFGHRHFPRNVPIGSQSRFVNLGDWIGHNTYAVYDGQTLDLKTYTPQ
ncbi:UDP-2,3-diacylglucosamine diphosphatase [bacterium]|nr:UDP-2,3-diacylglucosamine diphosphatase [bacterium]